LYQIYIETFFYALIFIFLQRWPVFLLSFGGKSLHISVLQLENERGRALVKDRAFSYARTGGTFSLCLLEMLEVENLRLFR
jgi:hypothetical protein